jgi:hypothetical protein
LYLESLEGGGGGGPFFMNESEEDGSTLGADAEL